MTDTANIRRRPDGSIDTAHYMARGRIQRARQARQMAGRGTARTRGPILALLAALLVIPGFN
mgnify:FL=1